MGDRDFTKTWWNYDCDRSLSGRFLPSAKTAHIGIAKQNLEIEQRTAEVGVSLACGKLLAKEQSQLFEN
jgi:hypothetical protein